MKQKKESKIQQEIVIWYRNNNLNSNNIIFSVPNEGKSATEQMYKKATGMLSGVSDLIVIEKDRILFIECKDETGKQRENQITFQNKIEANGFNYHLVRTLQDFINIINPQ